MQIDFYGMNTEPKSKNIKSITHTDATYYHVFGDF
jgi:hypothetical protein